MQNNTDWMMKYYDQESRAKVEARKSLWSPELQERVSRQWAELLTEVQASLGEDPASPKAQELADRWQSLVSEFTGGDPGIARGLKALYSDQQNWPEGFQQPFSNDAAAFIAKARAVRKKA